MTESEQGHDTVCNHHVMVFVFSFLKKKSFQMVAFRIPRLTLFSGPSCSLCDVRLFFFNSEALINANMVDCEVRISQSSTIGVLFACFRCNQSLYTSCRELSSWILSISRTKARKSGKRNMSTGYLLSISRAKRLPKVVGPNKRSIWL